ncbi:MAG: hypothetical protein DWQ06_11350 [Calditrichaeota bacterium]|nr:MAG: hypothetical protein DWQ06_11350 [Calditrichota bacterium]
MKVLAIAITLMIFSLVFGQDQIHTKDFEIIECEIVGMKDPFLFFTQKKKKYKINYFNIKKMMRNEQTLSFSNVKNKKSYFNNFEDFKTWNGGTEENENPPVDLEKFTEREFQVYLNSQSNHKLSKIEEKVNRISNTMIGLYFTSIGLAIISTILIAN